MYCPTCNWLPPKTIVTRFPILGADNWSIYETDKLHFMIVINTHILIYNEVI